MEKVVNARGVMIFPVLGVLRTRGYRCIQRWRTLETDLADTMIRRGYERRATVA